MSTSNVERKGRINRSTEHYIEEEFDMVPVARESGEVLDSQVSHQLSTKIPLLQKRHKGILNYLKDCQHFNIILYLFDIFS